MEFLGEGGGGVIPCITYWPGSVIYRIMLSHSYFSYVLLLQLLKSYILKSMLKSYILAAKKLHSEKLHSGC